MGTKCGYSRFVLLASPENDFTFLRVRKNDRVVL